MPRFTQRPLLNAIAIGLIGVTAFLTWSPAEAAPQEQYRIYPGLYGDRDRELVEYGIHFDEIGYDAYGARDFNHDDDGHAPVFFRVRLTEPQESFAVRFTHLGACGVTAEAGRVGEGGNFTANPGESFHYLHLGARINDGHVETFDPAATHVQRIEIGALSDWGEPCTMGGPHLHQSADLTPGSGTTADAPAHGKGDSCWTSAPQDAWQCQGTFLEHLAWDLHGEPGHGRSGSVYDYIYQDWGGNTWSSSYPIFTVMRDVPDVLRPEDTSPDTPRMFRAPTTPEPSAGSRFRDLGLWRAIADRQYETNESPDEPSSWTRERNEPAR